jgi:hypothetical protein
LVVLVSITVHGISPMVLLRQKRQNAPDARVLKPLEPGRALEAKGSQAYLAHSEYIDIAELRALQQTGVSVAIADARTERTFNESEFLAHNAVRLDPDRAVVDATECNLAKDTVITVICA